MKKLYIDVGGTHLRANLYENEILLEDIKVSSKDNLLWGFTQKIILANRDIDFIGISYAGQVRDGVILSSPNITIDEHNIAKEAMDHYDIKLIIQNDLNCAALAERDYFKSEYIAVLYVGSGLGSAVIDNSRLISGSLNLAFELGHIPYRQTSLTCGCGKNNCLELFASGSGIKKHLEYNNLDITPTLEAIKNSNRYDIASEFEEALLYACGVLVTLANPKILVLGGGVIKNNPYLVEFIKTNLKKVAFSPSLQNLEIRASELKNGSLEGAKLLQRELL